MNIYQEFSNLLTRYKYTQVDTISKQEILQGLEDLFLKLPLEKQLTLVLPEGLHHLQEEIVENAFAEEINYDEEPNESHMKRFFSSVSFLNTTVIVSDTFGYAYADAEDIHGDDLEDLQPWIFRYGYFAIVAYVSLKRDRDPLPCYSTHPLFKKLKNKFRELASTSNYVFYDIAPLLESDKLDINAGLVDSDPRVRERFKEKVRRSK